MIELHEYFVSFSNVYKIICNHATFSINMDKRAVEILREVFDMSNNLLHFSKNLHFVVNHVDDNLKVRLNNHRTISFIKTYFQSLGQGLSLNHIITVSICNEEISIVVSDNIITTKTFRISFATIIKIKFNSIRIWLYPYNQATRKALFSTFNGFAHVFSSHR